jgi:hypothetical protein
LRSITLAETTVVTAGQIIVMVVAVAAISWLRYMMFRPHNPMRMFARKNRMIYLTGALMWYLPSLRTAAGVRRGFGVKIPRLTRPRRHRYL